MEIEERTEGDLTILFLRGKMVGDENAEMLHEKVEDLIEAGSINLVLDLADVPDIDSAGLGEILHCHIRVTKKGGSLKLANLSEKLRVLLTRTKIAWVHEDLLSDPPS